MTVYYNENDPFNVAWMAELIKEGVIADGVVDSRSIKDVQPADLRGFTQHHFFAGIGGWSYALRLAGWPDDKPVWTGSCPCQPFSAAGKRKGTADERHLWPEFQRLIADGEPAIVFGEQVAAKDGRIWLAGIRADLEALGYAVGAADLCAAGVGAPHIRQRLWWVADAYGGLSGDGHLQSSGLADTVRSRTEHAPRQGLGAEATSDSEDGCLSRERLRLGLQGSISDRLGDTNYEGPQGRCLHVEEHADKRFARAPGLADNWWGESTIDCSDGRSRRVEPSIQPLAHGISNRVGTLRGAGNAILSALAAEFIQAACESGVG